MCRLNVWISSLVRADGRLHVSGYTRYFVVHLAYKFPFFLQARNVLNKYITIKTSSKWYFKTFFPWTKVPDNLGLGRPEDTSSSLWGFITPGFITLEVFITNCQRYDGTCRYTMRVKGAWGLPPPPPQLGFFLPEIRQWNILAILFVFQSVLQHLS